MPNRYQLKEIIKFSMLFGYKIIDTLECGDALYEYSENEYQRALSKVNLLNILDKTS